MASREQRRANHKRSTRGKLRHFWHYWVQPLLPVRQMLQSMGGFVTYLSDWSRYQKLPEAERLAFDESYPCLIDDVEKTDFDAHYFYQAIWAIERILRNPATLHVDIGSDVRFVGMMAAQRPMVFVDLRPLHAAYANLSCLRGDLLELPFASGSICSLSCLHVVEHVGLGRYGDRMEPAGTRYACAELARVVAPGGELYLSLPVGRQRVQFNAHRVLTPQNVLAALPNLQLVDFAAVTDQGVYQTEASLDELALAEYGCGLFHFRK